MNRLIKLLPSLLLIIIYFITDNFFGPESSLIATFFLGAGEFIYCRIRYKSNDWMVLIFTLIFCLPGFLTLYATESIWTKFIAGLPEISLCLLIGIFAFSRADLTENLPASYRQSFKISPLQQQSLKNTLKILFFLLCAHTLLFFVSVVYLSQTTSDFISGPLLYSTTGLFFLIIFIRSRLSARKYRQEEWLPLVNEKGEVTGQAPRSVCHSGSKLMHPVVHLHITNARNEIFLQKRSMKKDLLPGVWDTAVGGHIGLHEKVEDALKREAYEELGISRFKARLIDNYIWESPREKELVFSFLCTQYDNIHIDNEEVEEGRFWTREEIESGIPRQLFTPNFVHEYQNIMEKLKR